MTTARMTMPVLDEAKTSNALPFPALTDAPDALFRSGADAMLLRLPARNAELPVVGIGPENLAAAMPVVVRHVYRAPREN